MPQPLDHVVADVVTHTVDVPVRTAQQALHPIRADLPGMFGQGPTILAFQADDKPINVPASPLTRL
ncbi:hypothetical protein GCM10027290_30620 [Micromonospora sonneratiae]